MTSFLLLFTYIGFGLLLQYVHVVPKKFHQFISKWILTIALPALSIKHLVPLKFEASLAIPALAPVVALTMAFLISRLCAQLFKFDKGTKRVLFLVSGLCNTSFIGFPLVTSYFGDHSLSTAVICDQITFLLFSTVGFMTLLGHTEQGTDLKTIAKSVVKFPPFIACVVALCIPAQTNLALLQPLLSGLSATVAPLALFVIGLRLNLRLNMQQMKVTVVAVFLKLVVIPLLVFLLFSLCFETNQLTSVSIFETAMPTLLSLVFLAERYNFHTQLITTITSYSILLSFVSTYLWQLLLQHY